MPRLLFAAILLFAAVSPVFAYRGSHGSHGDDRVSFGSDITVNEGETAGDIACAFCAVHLHGNTHGDVAVLFGSVTVAEDQSIAGDVAILGGDLSLADNSSVGGDLALAAGDLNISPEATIHGDRMVLPGRFWLVVPFAPLLILIGIIWLIVHFVRRRRYPPQYYPPVRRP
ncbi:hypothetical protein [Granulicella arctica]|uniref:Polymer-forming cytoskeletal protein n=1 Tax=Granulicella arctica TaxID=940613 RepID=A0A7Y9PFX2_9BACT|nr:hypothetical protein [Granulicella arctica]NYF79156.1 hypothetical protein [Granulicella arctica]